MEKLKSRKLWIAVAGVVSGIAAYLGGQREQALQLIMAAILGYLGAEGLSDAFGGKKRK